MSVLQPIQVDPLPISSGGKPSQIQKDMEKTNQTLTLLTAQSIADAKYDPPVPSPITLPSIREAFCNYDPHSLGEYLMMIGFGLIVYGVLAK